MSATSRGPIRDVVLHLSPGHLHKEEGTCSCREPHGKPSQASQLNCESCSSASSVGTCYFSWVFKSDEGVYTKRLTAVKANTRPRGGVMRKTAREFKGSLAGPSSGLNPLPGPLLPLVNRGQRTSSISKCGQTLRSLGYLLQLSCYEYLGFLLLPKSWDKQEY